MGSGWGRCGQNGVKVGSSERHQGEVGVAFFGAKKITRAHDQREGSSWAKGGSFEMGTGSGWGCCGVRVGWRRGRGGVETGSVAMGDP